MFSFRPKEAAFDLNKIKAYYENRDSSTAFQVLSEQTCSDLNLDDFFEALNQTSSCIGQQYLYDHIRCIFHESKVSKHENIVTFFDNNPESVNKYKKLLSSLSDYNAYYICSLFQQNHIIPSKVLLYALKALQFLPCIFVCLFLAFSKPAFIIIALLFFLVNFFFHYKNKQTLFSYLHSIPQYLKLVSIAKKFTETEIFDTINPNIKKQLDTVSLLNRQLSLFRFDMKMEASEAAALVWAAKEFFRIFFLLEPNILFNSFKLLNEKKNDIEGIFSHIGCIDMLLSISLFRKLTPKYCKPEWTTGKFQVSDIYHPLVDSCVSNSLDTEGKSILLTGSNMSGKSTFIRSIALNQLCGQTLNFCFASAFSAPKMKIHTAINLSDSLSESTSHYMKEVLTIKDMLDESQSGSRNLFLLDELFKGTNTLERIAGGKAVLSALATNGNLVFASTHDLELADLLAGEYQLYHFCEQINQDELSFDYKLKTGKLRNRNAIRLLEIKNYPPQVIAEANEIVQKLSHLTSLPGVTSNIG